MGRARHMDVDRSTHMVRDEPITAAAGSGAAIKRALYNGMRVRCTRCKKKLRNFSVNFSELRFCGNPLFAGKTRTLNGSEDDARHSGRREQKGLALSSVGALRLALGAGQAESIRRSCWQEGCIDD